MVGNQTHPNPQLQPILHTPWEEPTSHYKIDASEPLKSGVYKEGRRPSQPYVGPDFIDVTEFEEPYQTINEIRTHVADWRSQGYIGSPARKLLIRWRDCADNREGEMQPFFCQREATETLMWLFREGQDPAQVRILERLQETNTKWNDRLPRMAIKMATGTGKTRTMAMVVACLAKLHPEGCQVVVIVPNLTVLDRLSELHELPNSSELIGVGNVGIRRVSVKIVNFQKFRRNDSTFEGFGESPAKFEMELLDPENREESVDEMLDRLIGADEDSTPLYVFQDEGHHCRRFSEHASIGELKKEELDENGQWYRTLFHISKYRNLQRIIDFSATPSYLSKPKELNTSIFPWCITDFGVEDAIESGICKIPRLPIAIENSATDNRLSNLYRYCVDERRQPKKWGTEPPQEVKDLMFALAEDWKNTRFDAYQRGNRVPAVIIVVNLVANAVTLYRWIAGWKKGNEWIPGEIDVFSNIDVTTKNPLSQDDLPTLLVHSKIGEDTDKSNNEINTVRKEQAELRTPGQSTRESNAIIREIFQSVGKPGQRGANIRCVVSVAMLSEGWDANTVTHVLGFRRFDSSLLCEQVVGRALRRSSLDEPENPDYAEVFGVPYPHLSAIENDRPPVPPSVPYEVCSLDQQTQYSIEWPVIERIGIDSPRGLRYHFEPNLVQEWNPDLPSTILTRLRSVVGHGETFEFSGVDPRTNKTVYELASMLAEEWWSIGHESEQEDPIKQVKSRGTLFVDALAAIWKWLEHPLIRISRPALLSQANYSQIVLDSVREACVSELGEVAQALPVFKSRREPMRSTHETKFTTTLKNKLVNCQKSHLNTAACHSAWEVDVARILDSNSQVKAWVRNFRLEWRIPYWDQQMAIWREYEPDFVVLLNTDYPHYVIIEVKGIEDPSSLLKKEAAERFCSTLTKSNDSLLQSNWSYLYLDDQRKFQDQIESHFKDQ